MERIVLGVDAGSGEQALEWVIRRVVNRPAHVRLIRAFDLVDADPDEEDARLQHAKAEILRRSSSTEVESILVTEAIPAALLSASEDADLLVIGARRHRRFASALTGSLPLSLAARSSCVTVIVPDDWSPAMHRTVVVGVAGDHTDDRAMLFAAREAQAAGAELEAVHAWTITVPTMASPDMVIEPADERALHRGILSRALETIRAAYPKVRLRGLLEQRLPSTVLTEHAGRGEMLVLGSHRWGVLTGMVLGSTARAVLPAAAAPLCIVPPSVPQHSGGQSTQPESVSA